MTSVATKPVEPATMSFIISSNRITRLLGYNPKTAAKKKAMVVLLTVGSHYGAEYESAQQENLWWTNTVYRQENHPAGFILLGDYSGRHNMISLPKHLLLALSLVQLISRQYGIR